MGLFRKKEPQSRMQQHAERQAKADYARHKGEINAFLNGLSSADRDFFNRSIEELATLTLPYEGAISYPTALLGDIKRIGDALSGRLGQSALQYALYVYAPRAPRFSGQVEGEWFPGRGISITL